MKKEVTRSRPQSGQTGAAPGERSKGRFPIVAVGASAGGLEAFTSLMRSLPPNPGIALVFIPHLDPTHESAMVELLSRTTRLPVLPGRSVATASIVTDSAGAMAAVEV